MLSMILSRRVMRQDYLLQIDAALFDIHLLHTPKNVSTTSIIRLAWRTFRWQLLIISVCAFLPASFLPFG